MQRLFKAKTVIDSEKAKSFHEPPIKVIRATSDFKSDDKNKLSFVRGDYFYVTSFDLKNPNIYQVVNPLTNLSGFVESEYFEDVSRKTHLPSPNDPYSEDEGLKRTTSKTVFSNPFRSKLRTGGSKKGSVSSIVTSVSVLGSGPNAFVYSPVSFNMKNGNKTDGEYNQMFYSNEPKDSRRYEIDSLEGDRLHRTSTKDLDMIGRESPMDLPGRELPTENVEGLSLLQVEHVTVLEKANENYSIILKFDDENIRIIHRSYSELCYFHFQLLEMFPGHAGLNYSPRIIPFLSSNNPSTEELETYILESKNLPNDILKSRHWTEFLKLRHGDKEFTEYETQELEIQNEVLDCINEYEKSTIVKIKLSLSTGQVYSFRAETQCSYRNMIKSLETKLNQTINEVMYWNENKQMTKIHGDQDLQLLFRTCSRPMLYSK